MDNLGAAKRYDINLKYELISLNTNEIVTFKEETMAIETRGSKQIAMQIPSGSAGGDYVLRAIATYNGQRAVATLPVKIEAQDQEMKEYVEKEEGKDGQMDEDEFDIPTFLRQIR